MKKKFLIYIAIFIIILIGCLSYKAPTKSEFVQVPENIIIQEEELARGIAKLCNAWNIQASTCAENNLFYAYGITPNCCIDPVLIDKLFSAKDPLLNEYMEQFRQPAIPLKEPLFRQKEGEENE